MNDGLNAKTIVDEIEFELMQSVVSHGELAQGVLAVRQHQQEVWSEIAPRLAGKGELSEPIKHLFRLNEMLLTLLEQTISDTHARRLEYRKLERLVFSLHETIGPAGLGDDRREPEALEGRDGEDSLRSERSSIMKVSDMLNAVDQVPTALTIDVRSSRLPLIGSILSRIRTALHSVAVFYVNRFALRQADVNAGYRDLLQQLVGIVTTQQEEIDVLRMQLKVSGSETHHD